MKEAYGEYTYDVDNTNHVYTFTFAGLPEEKADYTVVYKLPNGSEQTQEYKSISYDDFIQNALANADSMKEAYGEYTYDVDNTNHVYTFTFKGLTPKDDSKDNQSGDKGNQGTDTDNQGNTGSNGNADSGNTSNGNAGKESTAEQASDKAAKPGATKSANADLVKQTAKAELPVTGEDSDWSNLLAVIGLVTLTGAFVYRKGKYNF